MTEEKNNDIILAGDDRGYLAVPVRRKYYMAFIWSHPFSLCGS